MGAEKQDGKERYCVRETGSFSYKIATGRKGYLVGGLCYVLIHIYHGEKLSGPSEYQSW